MDRKKALLSEGEICGAFRNIYCYLLFAKTRKPNVLDSYAIILDVAYLRRTLSTILSFSQSENMPPHTKFM